MSNNKLRFKSEKISLGGPKLVITVKEARKILGADANPLSDDDIIHMISSLSKIADSLFDSSI